MAEPHGEMGRREAQGQLLAWLILAFRSPSAESLRQLRETDLGSLFGAAGIADTGAAVQSLLDHSRAEDDSLLKSEYVRLFVNARGGELAFLEATAYLFEHGPEAQSSYLEELAAELREAGLSPAAAATLPPDHLTMLLERLYYLEGALREPLAEHAFVRRFLDGWIPAMLERLASARPPALYGAAGATLALLLGLDPPPPASD